ncbi:uncharacterized protein LOC129618299 [Condylostylus longicornis]|uniref:uncharacterized protein LOC129618299 n=1 Tax=Condylostylus longicornis TaxID=2530218 RepID=UPI00244DAD2E|nr:uncharacterized protein LOC129618299 [Condylostylus longicornis]
MEDVVVNLRSPRPVQSADTSEARSNSRMFLKTRREKREEMKSERILFSKGHQERGHYSRIGLNGEESLDHLVDDTQRPLLFIDPVHGMNRLNSNASSAGSIELRKAGTREHLKTTTTDADLRKDSSASTDEVVERKGSGDEKSREDKPKRWGPLQVAIDQPYLSVMLIFIPLGIVSYFLDWGDTVTFSLNFIAIIPQAWLIGKATEDLASHLGQVLGGILNAWFGNIVEMLLCIAAIRAGELLVVKATLVGSILSNLLLVAGCSFLFGGFYHKLFMSWITDALRNHSPFVRDVRAPHVKERVLFPHFHVHPEEDEEEDVDLSIIWASVILGVCTVCCAMNSEFLIASIEGTVDKLNISKSFIGIILLPIIGNAAEHYTSVIVAMRNKMDLSLACAVGSSCQMALFVTPFTVLAGWVFDVPMSLDLHAFEMAVLLLAVLIVTR